MSRYLKLYKPFINAGLQEAVTYRAQWIFGLFGNVLGCFISFFIWNAVFLSSNGETFMGFDMQQMVIYIFLTFLTGVLIGSGGTYDIGEEIRDGSIAMRMIKPISYNSTFLFQELGNKLMTVGVVFVPLVLGVELYRFFTVGSLQFDVLRFLLYLLSVVFAYLINFFFNICYGFTAFVFKNLWGSNMLKNCLVGFLSGSVIPIAFLPSPLKETMLLLPFSSLNYTPVMLYMGAYNVGETIFYISLQLFWCVAFWLLSKAIWKVVVKHLCVQGG